MSEAVIIIDPTIVLFKMNQYDDKRVDSFKTLVQ